jgi:hypothetical protein
MWDFRWRVKPKLCTDVDIRPTNMPICEQADSQLSVLLGGEESLGLEFLQLRFLLAKGRPGFPSR